MSWRQFYWEWAKQTFKQSIGAPQIVALLVSIVVGSLVTRLPGVEQVDFLSWLLPAVVLCILLLVNLVRTPFNMHRELERQVVPSVRIVFDPNQYRSCRQDDDYAGGHGEQIISRLFRVAVVNSAIVTVDEVKIWLTEFSPQGAPFLPIELRFMHDHSFDSGISRNGVSVYHQQPQFVDVASKRSDLPYINLHYAVPNVANQIPVGRYELTLRATARNAPFCEGRFVIDVDKAGVPSFRWEGSLEVV